MRGSLGHGSRGDRFDRRDGSGETALSIGDAVRESPVGPGTITGFNGRGFPQVNEVAVSWLVLADGTVFDPFGSGARAHA